MYHDRDKAELFVVSHGQREHCRNLMIRIRDHIDRFLNETRGGARSEGGKEEEREPGKIAIESRSEERRGGRGNGGIRFRGTIGSEGRG